VVWDGAGRNDVADVVPATAALKIVGLFHEIDEGCTTDGRDQEDEG
jgi:hypothetical protein